jgi:hypothetical protein
MPQLENPKMPPIRDFIGGLHWWTSLVVFSPSQLWHSFTFLTRDIVRGESRRPFPTPLQGSSGLGAGLPRAGTLGSKPFGLSGPKALWATGACLPRAATHKR